MMIGSLIVAVCLVILGWTKEIVGIFIGDPDMVKTCSVAVAVLSIYALDFAINAGELSYEMLNCCAIPLSEC
jgi:solute carrier family 45 protein 1/2/4